MRPTVLSLALVAVSACAQMPAASSAWTEGVKFTPMGATNPGAAAATLDGSTSAAAPYTIRVHIEKGGKIAPHTHPDTRVVTVVAGELCYGFGATFDPDACKLYPEGSYFIVPANAPHFGFGKTGDAIYQESGVGPSAFVPVSGATTP